MTKTLFAMGTCGDKKDPMFDDWRDAIKALLPPTIELFDPVVDEWNDAADRAEKEAFRNADIFIMAVRTSAESWGSLAESGWMAVRALLTGKPVIIYVEQFTEGDILRGQHLTKSECKSLNQARKLMLSRADDCYAMDDNGRLKNVTVLQIWGDFVEAVLNECNGKTYRW